MKKVETYVLDGQKLGRFEIVKQLGAGGFGAVYQAFDPWMLRHVALKVPHRQQGSKEELLQEVRMWVAVSHPHVVMVHDVFYDEAKDKDFVVLEYMEGGALDSYLNKNGPLSIPHAVDLLAQVLEAVVHAHKKRVLHRDLRPANILLSADGKIAKIADFGTSRFLSTSAIAETRIGAPPYMAPEHLSGEATFRSDIYAIGIMAYEIFAGQLPYFSTDPKKLKQMIENELYHPLHQKNKNVSIELSGIVSKAMKKEQSNRFQDADEFLSTLNAYSSSKSTLPRDSFERMLPHKGVGRLIPKKKKRD